MRKDIMGQNLGRIHELNQNSNSETKFEVNEFGDLSPEEFARRLTYKSSVLDERNEISEGIPSQVAPIDWRL
jgi:hypothetical protein